MQRMQSKAQGRTLRWLVRKHLSFVVGLSTAAVAFAVLTERTFDPSNLLVAWNLGALAFISITWYRMLHATVERIRHRADNFDFSDMVLLALSITAALASIAGLLLELHSSKNAPPDVALLHAGAAVLTILISWTFLHTLFTVHYAHRYYGAAGGGGLKFPDEIKTPLYWDFLYFSFTIGVAAQTADVAVSSTVMRRLALLHAVLSFVFNTTILALAVNVGASLI